MLQEMIRWGEKENRKKCCQNFVRNVESTGSSSSVNKIRTGKRVKI